MTTAATSAHDENRHISCNELLQLFEEKKGTGGSFDPSVVQLVNWLGGIDIVMKTMLTEPNCRMSDDDRTNMFDHLCSTKPHKLKEAVDPSSPAKENPFHLQWTLDPGDNVLHSLNPALSSYLYSKYSVAVLVLTSVPPFLLVNAFSDSAWPYLLFAALNILYPVPWFIAATLTVNRAMIPRILARPDTWIIIGTQALLVVYYAIYLLSTNELPTAVMVFHIASFSVFGVFFFSILCALDGIAEWTRMSRIMVTTTFAMVSLFWSFYWEFAVSDKVFEVPFLGQYGRISINARLSGSLWVLFLFIAKMAVNSWRRAGNRCVAVTYFPYIEWKCQSDGKDIENALAAEVQQADSASEGYKKSTNV